MSDWYGVPDALWLPCLSIQERHLLAEVHSFTSNGLTCFASNGHFSERLLLSESRTRKLIYKLISEGWLMKSRELVEGVRKRTLWLNMDKVAENGHSGQIQPHCPNPARKVSKSGQQGVQIQPHGVSKSGHIKNQYTETVNISKKEASKKRKAFKKPEMNELVEAFRAGGMGADQAEIFWNHYESNGWKVGRNSMKDWKATVRNWIIRNNEERTNKEQQRNGFDPHSIDRQQLATYIKEGNAGT